MRFALILLSLLSASGAEGATYLVAPAPALEPAPASATASAGQGSRSVLVLVPFEDRRRQKELWKGSANFEAVQVEAAGLTLEAKGWRGGKFGSVSLLWHRQLGQALAQAGYAVSEADQPAEGAGAGESGAGGQGTSFQLGGELKRLDIAKRGSDGFLGTNFSGTDYTFSLAAHVTVKELATGRGSMDRNWAYTRVFHDPTSMGSSDQDTFPGYFLLGIQEASRRLADDGALRVLAGLPTCTVTPTPTPTANPKLVTPTPAAPSAPAVLGNATATPQPPDDQPYWVNPRTGKRVDHAWNFDPMDGTPRKDFVLRLPSTVRATRPLQVTLTPTPTP